LVTALLTALVTALLTAQVTARLTAQVTALLTAQVTARKFQDMKKINKLNTIRIISFLLFTFYLTFNGVDIKLGSLKIYTKGLIERYRSDK
jgi:hypothetical protein